MKIKYIVIVALVVIFALGNSCAISKYNRAGVSGYFSIEYPESFNCTISKEPPWDGYTPEIDLENESNTIFVVGINGSYKEIVDYDVNQSYFKGGLISQSDKMTVLGLTTEEDMRFEIRLDYDVGDNRTIYVGGITVSVKKWEDILIQNCISIAKSVKVSPDWKSDNSIPPKH